MKSNRSIRKRKHKMTELKNVIYVINMLHMYTKYNKFSKDSQIVFNKQNLTICLSHSGTSKVK